MRVKIGNYTSWYGPHHLAETLCFWAKKDVVDEYGCKDYPDYVFKLGEWLAYGKWRGVDDIPHSKENLFRNNEPETWLYKFLLWINSKKKQKIEVRIDPWDTWSMDHTLAHIVLPMLKQLKETKHGAPYVDLKDVPKELQPKKQTKKQKDNCETDSTHFERWDWVLDEMIFAFENKLDDSWEDQFESGTSDTHFVKLEDGNYEMVKGPNDTKVYDWEGRKAYQERISNGFRLFGKYYENLWD